MDVSKELNRTEWLFKMNGYSKRKAKFFTEPKNLEEQIRNRLEQDGVQFVSLDETSFGRHAWFTGYDPYANFQVKSNILNVSKVAVYK